MSPAERLLQELGVTDPKEIDLEAIAFHVKARVRYRALEGCEARIVGNEREAIITVNSASSARRQRFSIAHELGHWHHDRGKCLACRLEDYRPSETRSPERGADGYAADLLMPYYLFRPLAREIGKPNFKTVAALAEIFKASKVATAIRLVESNQAPTILVCHGSNGRKWFTRAQSVPKKWFPQDSLHSDSYAFGIQFGNSSDDATPHKIGADAWFDRRDADRFEVFEQTIRMSAQETLTLLQINNGKMLED